jgi:hypothetical protein
MISWTRLENPMRCWCLLLVTACSDSGGTQMDPPDAPPADAATCTLPPGNAYVVTSLNLLPPDQGTDHDGDGTIDNRLGEIPLSYATEFNEGTDIAIASGQLLLAMYVTGWSDPPTPDDPDAVFHAYHVFDADMPADESNNLSGAGEFLVPITQFDLSCGTPQHTAESTELAGGVMTARSDEFDFHLSSTGSVQTRDATMVITFASDFVTAGGDFGATVSLCTLAALPFPGQAATGSVLDVIVNDPNLRDTLIPDLDVDGDGFERVEGDGVTILRCLDGDGQVIDGSDCPCHPSIADAYSMGLRFEFISGRIVGVL